jgi:translation elongation factor P/translation initiation factor 5A
MHEKSEYISNKLLKIGDMVLINENPCKITQITYSNPGKCGNPKVHFICSNIFNDEKIDHIELVSKTTKIFVPTILHRVILDIYQNILETFDVKTNVYESIVVTNDDFLNKIKFHIDKGDLIQSTIISNANSNANLNRIIEWSISNDE